MENAAEKNASLTSESYAWGNAFRKSFLAPVVGWPRTQGERKDETAGDRFWPGIIGLTGIEDCMPEAV